MKQNRGNALIFCKISGGAGEARTPDLRFRKTANRTQFVCFQQFMSGDFGGFRVDIGQFGYSFGYKVWV